MKARKLLLVAALVAVPAFAQQNVDISGKDFLSGAGDARFATVGRQAAASGKRIVVTAPQEWHAKIAAKIHAGGASADVVLKDGFYENVLVRVEDKPAEPKAEGSRAELRPEAKPEPKPAARVAAERVPVEVPGPKPTLPPPAPAVSEPPPAPAPVVSAPPPAPATAPAASTAPAPVRQVPAQAVATRAPAVAAAPKPDVAAIQKRFEQSLNNGREAEGPLSVAGLESGDFIFVDGPVRAVVRRESLRPRLFWLDGELDLRRTELKELGPNRYQVIEPIRVANYAVRDEREESKSLVAAEPAAKSPARATFERDFNDGHTIGETITVDKLRSGDLVYAGKGLAVIVRREGAVLSRFWLVGTLDLGQSGLQKDGANKYKVTSDTLH